MMDYENIDVEVMNNKKTFTDKALDFLIGVGEEFEKHPAKIMGTAILAAFCYGRGRKSGYKKGYNLGVNDEYNALREFLTYQNENLEEWSFVDIAKNGGAEYVEAFSKAEKDEYDACRKIRHKIKEAKENGNIIKIETTDITK